MMRTTGMVLLLVTLTLGATSGDQRGNEFVSVDVRLESTAMKAGGHGRIIISLKPKKGIHINISPPMELRLDKPNALSGKLEYYTVRKDSAEYLDPSKGVKQSFTLSPALKPGTASLTGTFVYFYCSDAEGWCSRFKLPLDLKVTVKP